jgi:hypothetical protein
LLSSLEEMKEWKACFSSSKITDFFCFN